MLCVVCCVSVSKEDVIRQKDIDKCNFLWDDFRYRSYPNRASIEKIEELYGFTTRLLVGYMTVKQDDIFPGLLVWYRVPKEYEKQVNYALYLLHKQWQESGDYNLDLAEREWKKITVNEIPRKANGNYDYVRTTHVSKPVNWMQAHNRRGGGEESEDNNNNNNNNNDDIGDNENDDNDLVMGTSGSASGGVMDSMMGCMTTTPGMDGAIDDATSESEFDYDGTFSQDKKVFNNNSPTINTNNNMNIDNSPTISPNNNTNNNASSNVITADDYGCPDYDAFIDTMYPKGNGLELVDNEQNRQMADEELNELYFNMETSSFHMVNASQIRDNPMERQECEEIIRGLQKKVGYKLYIVQKCIPHWYTEMMKNSKMLMWVGMGKLFECSWLACSEGPVC